MLVASLSIQFNDNETYPCPYYDSLESIVTTFSYYGEDCRKIVIFTTNINHNFSSEVVICNTERDLLVQWSKFMQASDIEILTGFNIFLYDIRILIVRWEVNECFNECCHLGKNHEAIVTKIKRGLVYYEIPSRKIIDTYHKSTDGSKVTSFFQDFYTNNSDNDIVTLTTIGNKLLCLLYEDV
jgi:DNA polymerase elongation subunit (family B)